jgi:hypothetical protein
MAPDGIRTHNLSMRVATDLLMTIYVPKNVFLYLRLSFCYSYFPDSSYLGHDT